jgi:hypothetical protein
MLEAWLVALIQTSSETHHGCHVVNPVNCPKVGMQIKPTKNVAVRHIPTSIAVSKSTVSH